MNWKVWDNYNKYAELLYKRAIGEAEEMESAKVFCNILSRYYVAGMSILDVGCGAGHYLRSLKERVDKQINYTGVDSTESHILLAKKAFHNKKQFFVDDIFNLQFENDTYDIVMCNNVLLHLPPPPTIPLSELIRVAQKHVIIRTTFGVRNYIIKEIRNSDELDGSCLKEDNLISPDGEVHAYNFFNLYSEKYIREIINSVAPGVIVNIENEKVQEIFDNNKYIIGDTATKIVNGMQVSGNIILDWRFIIISKK